MTGQLRYLVRHFLRSMFDTGATADGESRLGFATTLSLLAVPGAIIAITLFPKYSSLMRMLRKQVVFDPDAASLPDKYVFIVLSMTVTGIVAALKWESLFPDRRDFANLAALPVPTVSILFAKSIALALFALIFVVDVNAVSSFVFPLTVLESKGTIVDVIRFVAAHVFSVAAAGLWTFAAFLALTGTMMAILPYGVFRRAKRYAQFLCLVGLLVQFFSIGAVWPQLQRMSQGGESWASALPSVWFLGMYLNAQGVAGGSLNTAGAGAPYTLAGTFVLAIAAYALSYRWFFLKSAEAVDVSGHALRFPDWAYRALDRTVLRGSFDRACFRFVLKTLARSDRHTAVVTSLLGLGCALALGGVNYGLLRRNVTLAVLSPSLILIYALLTGLRFSFGVPSDPRANWIFRVCADEEASPQGTVQRVMFLFVSPLIVVTAAAVAVIRGEGMALLHVVFLVCTSLLLIECLTMEFRVIPFTCSWIPGSGNIVFALAMFVVGLSVIGQFMAELETALLARNALFVPFLMFTAGALYAFRQTRTNRERILYQDTRGELELLRLES